MKIVERLARGAGILGEVTLVFMVLSIAYDVVMRYLFLAPTIWALEVNTFLLVFLCAVPGADVLTAGSQIQITFLTDRIAAGLRERLFLVADLAGAVFSAIMTWKGLSLAWNAWQHGDRMSTSLGTPMVIPYLFLPLGFGLLGLTYLARMARRVGARPVPGEADQAGQQI